jgi:hypothetical protein
MDCPPVYPEGFLMNFDQLVDRLREAGDQTAFVRFLIGFARIDYGIRCEGSLVRPNGSIRWNAFSDDLADDFVRCGCFQATEFVLHPPAKWDQSQRRFIEQQSITETRELIKALNRLRNDLFHGNRGVLASRDRQRCSDALAILQSIYDACRVGNARMQKIAKWAAAVDE